MKTEQEIKVKLKNITSQLENRQAYPINSWKRRRLIQSYSVLFWVLYE